MGLEDLEQPLEREEGEASLPNQEQVDLVLDPPTAPIVLSPIPEAISPARVVTIMPIDQELDFEPLKLDKFRRRSTDNLLQPSIDPDGQGNLSDDTRFGSSYYRESTEVTSEEEPIEDDELTSEDELFIKQFPNSTLAKDLKKSMAGPASKKGKGRKKVGKGNAKQSR